MSQRIQRKLKKKIIKYFGRGTFKGIKSGFLKIEGWGNTGSITKYTMKPSSDNKFYYSHQRLYMRLKNVEVNWRK